MKMMETCGRNPKNSKHTTFGPLYKKLVAEKIANICQQFCPLRLALLLCKLNHPSPLRTWEHCNCQGATFFKKSLQICRKTSRKTSTFRAGLALVPNFRRPLLSKQPLLEWTQGCTGTSTY